MKALLYAFNVFIFSELAFGIASSDIRDDEVYSNPQSALITWNPSKTVMKTTLPTWMHYSIRLSLVHLPILPLYLRGGLGGGVSVFNIII